MRLYGCLFVVFSLAMPCAAELPAYYKTVSRVTWVVGNIDKVRPAWEALGLSDIHEYPNIQLTGRFRGKALTIYAWEIVGRLGNLTVEMIQPAEAQANAYTSYLSAHGDGILSIVHEVASRQALDAEILRMKAKGVDVLQQVTVQRDRVPVTYTYFDTEPEGKFALGLVYAPGGLPAAAGTTVVSHFSPVVWDAAAVSAYWGKLGFPAFPMQHAGPRPDGRYKGQPLSLAFEVGYQRHTQFRYEWISPPPSPPNIYADFLNRHHREGIQHIGMPVADLEKAISAYEKLGYHVHQSGAWGEVGKPGSGQYAYMETDVAGGISVELVHSYKDYMRALFGILLMFVASSYGQDTVYICPMDPDIRSSAPGNCSRCGMKLRSGIPEPVEYPVDLRVSPRAPRPGEKAQLKFLVRNPWNRRAVTKFQPVHEKLFHLFVVSQDLQFFAHDHPNLSADGTFGIDLAFPGAGLYRLLADFYPDGGTPQLAVKSLIVPGKSPGPAALVRDYEVKDTQNLRVELVTDPPQPIAGTKTMLFFRVSPTAGLEPYLGAWGHMLAASDDLIDLIHEHPFLADGGPQIQFNLIFPRARTYRLWVQFQRQGVVNTAHFDVPVHALQ